MFSTLKWGPQHRIAWGTLHGKSRCTVDAHTWPLSVLLVLTLCLPDERAWVFAIAENAISKYVAHVSLQQYREPPCSVSEKSLWRAAGSMYGDMTARTPSTWPVRSRGGSGMVNPETLLRPQDIPRPGWRRGGQGIPVPWQRGGWSTHHAQVQGNLRNPARLPPGGRTSAGPMVPASAARGRCGAGL